MIRAKHLVGCWHPFLRATTSNSTSPLISSAPLVRNSSSSSSKTLATPAVCLSKDGSTFLAYHPQRDFPYEHSRPLPSKIDDEDSASPLNVQIVKAFKEKSTSNKLSETDLEKMFSECKQFFRPQPQERKRKDVAEYEKMLKLKKLNELPEDWSDFLDSDAVTIACQYFRQSWTHFAVVFMSNYHRLKCRCTNSDLVNILCLRGKVQIVRVLHSLASRFIILHTLSWFIFRSSEHESSVDFPLTAK